QEISMRLKIAAVALAALGGVALTSTAVSAMPNGIPNANEIVGQTSNVQQARWVQGPRGRVWRRTGPRVTFGARRVSRPGPRVAFAPRRVWHPGWRGAYAAWGTGPAWGAGPASSTGPAWGVGPVWGPRPVWGVRPGWGWNSTWW